MTTPIQWLDVTALCGEVVEATYDGDLTLVYADGRRLTIVPRGYHGEFEDLGICEADKP